MKPPGVEEARVHGYWLTPTVLLQPISTTCCLPNGHQRFLRRPRGGGAMLPDMLPALGTYSGA